MSEVEYDTLLDVVRTAVAPVSRKTQAPPAANENKVDARWFGLRPKTGKRPGKA